MLRHAVLITHVQLIVSFVHSELRDAEIAPASRLRREVAHPRHDAVEVAVVHSTARRVVQIHHVIEVGQLSVHPGVRQLQQLRVRRGDRIRHALERREREEEPEILGEDERVGGEARAGDSVAVEEGKHLDGLVGDEEPDDRRLQQVLVVLLHGGDGRLVVVGYHEAVGRGVNDRFERENVRMVRLDRGFQVFRQLAVIAREKEYVERKRGWLHDGSARAVEDDRVFLFERRGLGERVENGEKFSERVGRILGHWSRYGVVLVEHLVIL